jgi:hypothetical protein
MTTTAVIWWTTAVLFAAWAVGVAVKFGSAVHVLFWLAVVLAVTNLVTGRTRA